MTTDIANNNKNDFLSVAGSVAGFVASGGLLLASAEVFGGVLVATKGTFVQVAKTEALNHAASSALPNLVGMSRDFAAANPDAAAIVGILGMAGMAAGVICASGCVINASEAVSRIRSRKYDLLTFEAK